MALLYNSINGKKRYLGCGLVVIALGFGTYFMTGKGKSEFYAHDPEPIILKKTKNLKAFEDLVTTYESSDKSNGLIRGISNKTIENIITSWRTLPRNERLGVLKQIAQEESKEFLYNVGDSNEVNIGALAWMLFGSGNQ